MSLALRAITVFKGRTFAAAPLLCVCILTGCTSIRISGSEPTVSYGLGIVNVQLQPAPDKPLLVATDGFGLIASARSMTIGAVRESVATFPDGSACHTMIVVQSEIQFLALQKLLEENPGQLGSLCIVNKE